tara:strand:+ start:368 stop:703 length:336 start_codon:yes stop_codon:yes gene_type:complete
MNSQKKRLITIFSSLFLLSPLSLSSSALESSNPSLFNQNELNDSTEYIDLNTEIAGLKKKKKKKMKKMMKEPRISNIDEVTNSIKSNLPRNYRLKKIERKKNKFFVVIEKL